MVISTAGTPHFLIWGFLVQANLLSAQLGALLIANLGKQCVSFTVL